MEMTNRLYAVIAVVALGTFVAGAQQAPPTGAGGQTAGGQGRGGRQGGAPPPAAAPQVPLVSKRPTGASLGTIRAGASDNNIWFGWRVAMPTNAIKGMAGNVWEFVQDEWTASYADSTRSPGRRVIRGGSFEGAAINLRVRFRDSHPEIGAGPHVGFRCAK